MQLTRRRLALVVVCAVVLSSAATVLATVLIRSPAEIAARSAPPVPTPILAPVEQRVLSTTVVSRGTARFGSPQQVALAPSALKTGHRVVTSVPAAGSEVAEGAVLLTVSGRPVFALGGEQPSYRDLGPGVSGPDVEQLEQALRRIGLRPGAVDGRYDGATGSAVAALYRRAGSVAMSATAAQLDAVRPLEAELVPGSRAGAGVQLPADEVVFLPTVPVRLSEVTVGVGGVPDGPLLTVTDSTVTIDGSLTIDEARLVAAGMPVTIDEPALGITTTGRVARVADRPGTDGADAFHVFFSTAVDDPPPTLVGASVRLTVPVSSTGSAVLAVPVGAVSLAPDGSSRVERSVDGRQEFVTVEPGVSADGYVQVGGPLTAGDQVVVGVGGGGR